jgi:SPP1 family phage portal protein
MNDFFKRLFGWGSEPELPKIEETKAALESKEKNTIIYGARLRETLEAYLDAADIDSAKKMFACHRDEALKAISEYRWDEHKILERPNKKRIDREDYETSKLTRAIQRGTNETATFFMFGNPINITLGNKPEEAKELEPAFEAFKDFLDELYFNENLYDCRHITGSETECAKLYRLYKDEDGNVEVVCQIKSNSHGDTLYPMFNQYGKLVAFAIGYSLRNLDLEMEEHFDVYTRKNIWEFIKPATTPGQWVCVEKKESEFNGKIPIIYYNHEVDWEGAQPRIEKLEWRDSKHSDTVEYFGDPYLLVSEELVDNRLADPRENGKVMVISQDGRFEFVTPPDSADLVKNEKEDLQASIDKDTLTPDWSYKNIMGLGTLSGEAMRRANLPGYVKRTKLAVSTYNRLIKRDLNLLVHIMCNYTQLKDSTMVGKLKRMKLKFSYTDPFIGGIEDNSTEVATMIGAGAMSVQAAVAVNRHVEDKEAEVERIWQDKERMANIEAQAAAKANKNTQSKTE